MPGDIFLVFNEAVTHGLFGIGCMRSQVGNPVDHIFDQVKTIQIIPNHHVKRRGGRALFLVSPDMEIVVIGSAVRQAMDQPGITMKGKNDRPVRGEQDVKFLIR